jgi:ribosome-associated protein YbcJ (S4-like RNA binding protein)
MRSSHMWKKYLNKKKLSSDKKPESNRQKKLFRQNQILLVQFILTARTKNDQ